MTGPASIFGFNAKECTTIIGENPVLPRGFEVAQQFLVPFLNHDDGGSGRLDVNVNVTQPSIVACAPIA